MNSPSWAEFIEPSFYPNLYNIFSLSQELHNTGLKINKTKFQKFTRHMCANRNHGKLIFLLILPTNAYTKFSRILAIYTYLR